MKNKLSALKRLVMKSKISIIAATILFAAFGGSVFAQAAKFNPDYPIANWGTATYMALGYQLPTATARQLFYDAKNLRNDSEIKTKLEGRNISANGVMTTQFLSTITNKDGKKSIRMKVSVKSDSFSERNTIVALTASILTTGQKFEYEDNRALGGFVALYTQFYDSRKMFPKFHAERDKQQAERRAADEKQWAEQDA
ncbi:MAG: hypothetical protein FWH22_10895, partial [Fibromonadales bacterium]|nr:hypothetical protein [Fibromonadales bacterium]